MPRGLVGIEDDDGEGKSKHSRRNNLLGRFDTGDFLPHAVREWEGYFKYFEYFRYCDCWICANTPEHLP